MSKDQYDPRRGGGDEYAPRPVSRPAPAGYGETMEGWGQQPPPPPASAPSQPAVAPRTEHADEVVFSRPYNAYGDEVRKIRLRRPTGMDLRKCGYPMRAVLNPDTQQMDGLDFVPSNIAKLIVALSNPPLPMSTVDSLELDDYEKCSKLVCSFFTG